MIEGHQNFIDNFSFSKGIVEFYKFIFPLTNDYLSYILSFEDIKELFKNKKYQKTITKLKESNCDIFSLSIYPVSRLPRYTLLFRELIKHIEIPYLYEDASVMFQGLKELTEM